MTNSVQLGLPFGANQPKLFKLRFNAFAEFGLFSVEKKQKPSKDNPCTITSVPREDALCACLRETGLKVLLVTSNRREHFSFRPWLGGEEFADTLRIVCDFVD